MSADPFTLAATFALSAAQMGLSASRRIEGPRVKDLNVAVSEYGAAILQFHAKWKSDSCPYIFAEPLHEVKREAKTKGGKYNQYTYFATWASLFAGHEIEAFTRIWLDRHLVWQATEAGPQTLFPLSYSTMGSKGKSTVTNTVAIGDHLRLYLGTETQMPDPRMLSTIEELHGAGSCPAYRGIAYAMFEEIPVEKFGNRIPQVRIEGVRAAAPVYPFEQRDVGTNNNRLWCTRISPDGERLFWANSTHYVLFDLLSRAIITQGALPIAIRGSAESVGFYRDGTILAVAPGDVIGMDLVRFKADMSGIAAYDANIFPNIPFAQRWQDSVWVLQDGNGIEHWMTMPYSTIDYWFLDGTEFENSAMPGGTWRPTSFFVDLDGNIWAVGCSVADGTTTAHFSRIVTVEDNGPDHVAVTGLSASSGVLDAKARGFHYRDDSHDHFVLEWREVSLHIIDRTTGAITVTQTGAGLDVYNIAKQMSNVPPGAASFFVNGGGGVYNAREVSSMDLSIIRTIDMSDWVSDDPDGVLYIPALHALACWSQYGSEITLRYLDRIDGSATTLRHVVEDIAGQCDVDPATMDATALTQSVRGFGFVQAPGKDIVQPLLDLHDAFARPHGFILEFANRGAASGGTIAESALAEAGEDMPPWQSSRAEGGDLPRAVALSFADSEADNQTNLARSARAIETVKSARELPLDMTNLSLAPDEARDLATRYLRRRWMARQHHVTPYAMTQIGIEPGDVRTVMLSGTSHIAWASSMRIDADRRITIDWERDDPLIHALAGQDGGGMDGHLPDSITVPGPARAAILDIPLVRDGDETRVPFLYYSAGPYGDSFTGADIWMSDTLALDDYLGGWGSVPSGSGMTWGTTTAALGVSLPWLFDRKSALNVSFRGGTPSGATEDELLADDTLNLAALGNHTDGWELLQFSTATLESNGTWTLRGLLRGVRGTEHRIAGHAAGDMLVLLTGLFSRNVGASEIGDADAYRAVATGRSLDGAFEEQVTFAAVAQMPYAPVHGLLTLDTGSGDWSITATRRTRIGGANVDGQDVPLGETAQSWQADIMDGADVVRTITSASLPIAYSSAGQTADFGAPQTSLAVNLYQVAPDLALRGHPLAIAA